VGVICRPRATGWSRAAALPLAALAVHQLRYLLAYGGGAGRELAATGHGYLTSVVPWLLAGAALAAADGGRRLWRARAPGPHRRGAPSRARGTGSHRLGVPAGRRACRAAAGRRRRAEPPARWPAGSRPHDTPAGRRRAAGSPARTWLALTAVLVVAFVAQELLEGRLAAEHPGGLAGIVGHGGWWALPAAMGVAALLTLVLRGERALTARLAGGPPPPAATGAAPALPHSRPRAVRPPRPALAGGAAGRAPPRRAVPVA